MNRRYLLLLPLLLLFAPPSQAAAVEISAAEVYAQGRMIEEEVRLLMDHFGAPGMEVAEPIDVDLQPRQVWQKGYIVLTKIHILRRRHGLPLSSTSSLEPVRDMDAAPLYEQARRILTELRILKARLGVVGEVEPVRVVPGKRPVDVFNIYNQVTLDLEAITGEAIGPSYVFAEGMRVFEDVNGLLRRLGLEDTAFPPEKLPEVTPLPSLEAAFELMAEIQRLQRDAGVARTDFSLFRKRIDVRPDDVFTLVGMALAELQPVKAHLEMRNEITPPAEYYEGKTPADVHQLLRWIIRKLRLIRSL